MTTQKRKAATLGEIVQSRHIRQRSVFIAGVYRFLKTKNAFKLVRQAGFKRRKDAKAKAIEMYNAGV